MTSIPIIIDMRHHEEGLHREFAESHVHRCHLAHKTMKGNKDKKTIIVAIIKHGLPKYIRYV